MDDSITYIPVEFKYNGVLDLACDAAFQLRLSQETDNSYVMNRHARASIFSSALLLESTANALLATCELSSRMLQDVDKLSVLAKFELFTTISNPDAQFDRGSAIIQRIQELIRARNDFVHPKTKPIPTDITGFGPNSNGQWAMPFELTGEKYDGLGIPKRSMFWNADNAESVFRATITFLKFMICDVASFTPDDAQTSLHSYLQVGDASVIATFDEFRTELSNLNDLNLDLSFLGVVPIPDA